MAEMYCVDLCYVPIPLETRPCLQMPSLESWQGTVGHKFDVAYKVKTDIRRAHIVVGREPPGVVS